MSLIGELEFRSLLDKLPAGAYTCDAQGLITYFNQHAVQLWGRAPKLNDPMDRYCGSFKLSSPDGSPIAHDRCWMALALKQDKEYNRREIVVERPDGERLTALAHANPIHDGSGELLGAVNVLVDVSDRKRAQGGIETRAPRQAGRADVGAGGRARRAPARCRSTPRARAARVRGPKGRRQPQPARKRLPPNSGGGRLPRTIS